MISIRLLPYAVADGARNMAADEALLLTAEDGLASLRFYGWSPATLSLGYFQPAAARRADPRLAALPWVRRPSGGATLVHDRELTYALALPPGSPWQSGEPWMRRMHAIIAAALGRMAPGAHVRAVGEEGQRSGDVLCFQMQTAGDLIVGGSKIVGSAQRKHRRCLLQHGSVLLAQSAATPALPGVHELVGVDIEVERLADAVASEFGRATGWDLDRGSWTAAEQATIERLVLEKYGHALWNEKR